MRPILALLAFIATPALATPSFSISDTQCNLGQHCVFTITKTGKATSYSDVAFISTGAAAQALQVTVRFSRAETVHTVDDQSLAPGQFNATLKAARYAVIAQGQGDVDRFRHQQNAERFRGRPWERASTSWRSVMPHWIIVVLVIVILAVAYACCGDLSHGE